MRRRYIDNRTKMETGEIGAFRNGLGGPVDNSVRVVPSQVYA